MIRKRTAGLVAGLFALLALAVDPAAAQTSLNEDLITGLNLKLLYVAIPIAVLVEVILIYTVIKFKDSDEAKPTKENRRLEITWTVATAIILLFVGFAAYQLLGVTAIGGVTAASNPNAVEPATTHDFPGAVGPPQGEADNVVEIEVVAQKYFWVFNYPEETVNGNESRYVSNTGTMVMPANTTVYLHVTSIDWLHAFHVPKLALKQDAFPDKYNTISTEAYKTGTYQLYCAEYCGVGHSAMLGKVQVVSQEEYQNWLDEQKAGMTESESSGNESSGNESSGNESSGNQSAVAPPAALAA
ncbi:cytochrome c oxidase subunit II [Halorarius litoreus]|uniref:cytochrome c oxidase subunit II n=1 Tax=Halorarius litoreus TaxID=2962676 RepID=UPI0020CC5011|nr:cytochrome c oxidase subunit II [Halorarius litoreus]